MYIYFCVIMHGMHVIYKIVIVSDIEPSIFYIFLS